MMNEIAYDQACELAALIAALRPDWDEAGIVKQLGIAKARGTAFEVAHAALHAAEDPGNRTPAVIPLAGPHWARAKATSSAVGGDNMPGASRCPEPGHEAERAHNCRSCQSESKAAQTTQSTTPAPTVSPARVREIFEKAGVVR